MLWSLSQGLTEFPESPPPGLVTMPVAQGTQRRHNTMSGYRQAGDRAIRIDMLERLADMLRGEDSRGGFEAKADMLSITGMTLEQFADLMEGLGYRAERGEREKVKPVDAVIPAEGEAAATAAPEATRSPKSPRSAETAEAPPLPEAPTRWRSTTKPHPP